MHEMCGTAFRPSLLISRTVASVPSRVEPPAPNVTEKKAGLPCASWRRATRSFSMPSSVLGGKNSTLKRRCMPLIRASRLAGGNERGERPRDEAVHDCSEHAGPEAIHAKALDQRAHRPEQQAVDHENEKA